MLPVPSITYSMTPIVNCMTSQAKNYLYMYIVHLTAVSVDCSEQVTNQVSKLQRGNTNNVHSAAW